MRVLWLTGIVIVLDQATKLLVLKTMYLGQQIHLLGDWLKLTYTENPGMAFGITFGPRGMVTVFSVIATFLITLYLFKVRKGYLPYRTSLAFILGGAVGNIIDRVFYGAIFNSDSLFVGRVVDFIHVNVWSGFIPEALPLVGGTYLSLFPIWNVADMAIVCGVVGILYFQKKYHLVEYYGSAEASPLSEGAPDPVVVAPDETGSFVSNSFQESASHRSPSTITGETPPAIGRNSQEQEEEAAASRDTQQNPTDSPVGWKRERSAIDPPKTRGPEKDSDATR